LSLPVIQESIFPILSNLVVDQIPNIRFNVAKSYAVLIDVLKRLPDTESTVLSLEKTGKAGTVAPRVTSSSGNKSCLTWKNS